jgi:hypothetical protein
MPSGIPARHYQPFDWYWLADDGRLYCSRTQTTITTSDPDYITWSTEGNPGQATAWPLDTAGNQTTQALQDVLTPYSLTVT